MNKLKEIKNANLLKEDQHRINILNTTSSSLYFSWYGYENGVYDRLAVPHSSAAAHDSVCEVYPRHAEYARILIVSLEPVFMDVMKKEYVKESDMIVCVKDFKNTPIFKWKRGYFFVFVDEKGTYRLQSGCYLFVFNSSGRDLWLARISKRDVEGKYLRKDYVKVSHSIFVRAGKTVNVPFFSKCSSIRFREDDDFESGEYRLDVSCNSSVQVIKTYLKITVDGEKLKYNRITAEDHDEVLNYISAMKSGDFDRFFEDVSVTEGISISEREEEYLTQRYHTIKEGIKNLTDVDAKTVPKISLVFSGGGFRALTSCMGFLVGVEKIGLLNAASYINGLSGSTWAIMSWIISGNSPEEHLKYLSRSLDSSKKALVSDFFFKEGSNGLGYLKVKEMFDHFYSHKYKLLNFYGSLILNKVLPGNDHFFQTYSDIHKLISPVEHPLPVCVAVETKKKKIESIGRNIWYEFTPFDFMTPHFGGMKIPIEHLGGVFSEGVLVDAKPEYPISYFVGIWGSAISLAPHDILVEANDYIQRVGNKIGEAKNTIKNVGSSNTKKKRPKKTDSKKRLFSSSIPSISYGMSGLRGSEEKMRLADGGFATLKIHNIFKRHNFASVPAIWRQSNLIILFDSVKEKNDLCHLETAIKQAMILEMLFIENELSKEEIQTITSSKAAVFNMERGDIPDEIPVINPTDSNLPIVLYISTKENDTYNEIINDSFDPSIESFTDTLNFFYSTPNFLKLSGLTTQIILDPTILLTIRSAVKKSTDKLN